MTSIPGFAVTTALILGIAIVGMFIPPDISYHDGALVVDYGHPFFQLNGVIFGGYNSHEYGHYLQQQDMGENVYYVAVAIPSSIVNMIDVTNYLLTKRCIKRATYMSFPWERDATERGIAYERS